MWHGIFIDAWRDVVRARKRELDYSNLDIAEMANTSESVVQRDLCDRSDPPLSRIVAIATALQIPIEDLFIPSLPNGMKIKTLVEEYARLSEENKKLNETLAAMSEKVDGLRTRNEELKDEIIDVHRYYMRRG